MLCKIFYDSYLYSANYDICFLPFPGRCLCQVLSVLEFQHFFVNRIPEERFGMLGCFWNFMMMKYVSLRNYQYIDSFNVM